jgi:hypothetical protein
MSVQDLLGNEVTLKSSKASSHEIPDAPILPTFAEDAGSLARAKVQARGAKVKQVVVRTYVILTLLLLAAIGAGIYYLYLEYSKPGKRVVDYRPCEYVDEKQNIRITGRREYSYMQKSMFGHDFRQSDNVIETTQIDINGNALTIVGLDNGKWWAIPVGMGEKGIQLLKPAHTYIITMDKKAAVIDYTQFCQ